VNLSKTEKLRVDSLSFIQDKFREYYRENFSNVELPPEFEKREFGFFLVREKIMIRHLGFRRAKELKDFLVDRAPSHVYYSIAYYERPEEDMDRKGWLGADILFDIDADHIPTPCDKSHDTWTCRNCGLTQRGKAPEACPNCGGNKFEERTWPCEVCLEAAKRETMKLIDILTEDFGFSTDELKIRFSGQRGYHLHVESDVIRSLDSMARKEIVDYLVGIGLDPELHGLYEQKGDHRVVGPDLGDAGWRGRIARGIYDLLLNADKEKLLNIGLKRNIADLLIKSRDELIQGWKRGVAWNIRRGIGVETWKKIAIAGLESQIVRIDTVVTTDIHRLIRLTGTLHGKTGLVKTEVPVKWIEAFDPLREAVAFRKGSVRVHVIEAPKFRLGEEIYGPYSNREVELPTSAALLLLCKGLARLAT